MTDWRAVFAGAGVGGGYLLALAVVPGLAAARLAGVPLVLGAGLLAGSAAALAADVDPHGGAWHGPLAGGIAGGVFAVCFVAVLFANVDGGVYHGFNYVLATSAGEFPVVRTHGLLVVGGLAGVGWALIAALGLWAGRRALLRDSHRLIERR